ncbi:enoyl-CoA hydratase/isomerase family protein [Rhodobacteraceae bacterium]|nr:enoyl-CoA hydratase/isomerase family protein [Paracoccaceae bacterium]
MGTQSWLSFKMQNGGIALVTMVQAPVNAMDAKTLGDLAQLFVDLAENAEVKAVVLASGLKVFSAGLDLKQAQDYDKDQQNQIVRGLDVAFGKMFSFPKPLIAAVEGAAIAGGFFPVLCSDYRVAGPKARFGLAEVQVGVGLPAGTLEIARAMLSPNDLRRILQSGKPIRAEAALAAGIVDELVDADEVLNRAIHVAKEYAQLPPQAYGLVKQQIRGDTTALVEAAIADANSGKDDGWFTKETKAAMAKMIGTS